MDPGKEQNKQMAVAKRLKKKMGQGCNMGKILYKKRDELYEDNLIEQVLVAIEKGMRLPDWKYKKRNQLYENPSRF